MAWQRTIPFGYHMRQGKIEISSAEADTVKDIFARYLQGESLQHIAAALTAQGVRYHRHTDCWNKNMVKRILENRHYLGDELYSRIIDEKDFLAAQLVKSGKNIYAPCKISDQIRKKIVCGRCDAKLNRAIKNRKTSRWECENPDCGHTVYISDEALVGSINTLLNELAHMPETLTPRIPVEPVQSGNAQRVANELTNALNRGAESIEYLRTLVFAVAAERYNELPDGSLQHKVDKLRERLASGERGETIQQELLKTAVRSIRIADHNISMLVLANGQHIGKEAAEV